MQTIGFYSLPRGLTSVTAPNRAKFSPTALWCDFSPVEFLLRKMGRHLHMQTATWLVSRYLTGAAGPWDTRLSFDDDGEYFCRVVSASERIRFVRELTVYYRMTPSGRPSFVGYSDSKKDSLCLSMKLHNSKCARAACLNYLQSWLINFYPGRPDIVQELEGIALNLGGRLEVPQLRWKYAWLTPLFGHRFAKRAQTSLPEL